LTNLAKEIRWVNLTEDLRVGARPKQILTILDQLGRKASS
jgi:hypothetical protein